MLHLIKQGITLLACVICLLNLACCSHMHGGLTTTSVFSNSGVRVRPALCRPHIDSASQMNTLM